MPYEGSSVDNQKDRKLDAYDRKLDGNSYAILLVVF